MKSILFLAIISLILAGCAKETTTPKTLEELKTQKTTGEYQPSEYDKCIQEVNSIIAAREKCDAIDTDEEVEKYNDCIEQNPWTVTYDDCTALKK